MNEEQLLKQLHTVASADDATHLQRYFKTGPGEYGEGDIFIGVRVPAIRKIANQADAASLSTIRVLLHSPIHEARLLALLMMVRRYKRSSDSDQTEIYTLYLANTNYINNWDLVDLSAPSIVGAHLFSRDRKVLFELVESDLLWDRRIAMLATHYFIRNEDFDTTLALAGILLTDRHDLIHKATGWMLREVGKRNQPKEEEFLKKYCQKMPRTMLRYAIEKFPPEKRRVYMKTSSAGIPARDRKA